MRQTLRSVLTALGALARLGVLAGCSDKAPSDPSNERGSETVAIKEAGLTFELPEGWVELDVDEALAASTDEELMAELVAKHGPDTERSPVEIFISTTGIPGVPGVPDPAFIASAKGVENGVLATMRVDVRPLEDDARLSLTEIEQNYRRGPLGMDYVDLTEVDTAAGPAVLSGFASTIKDPVYHQAQLILQTGSTAVTFSFLTDARDESEQLATDLADSLEPLS